MSPTIRALHASVRGSCVLGVKRAHPGWQLRAVARFLLHSIPAPNGAPLKPLPLLPPPKLHPNDAFGRLFRAKKKHRPDGCQVAPKESEPQHFRRRWARPSLGNRGGVPCSFYGFGSKPMGSHFGIGAPPMAEPNVWGLGCSLRVRYGVLTHGQMVLPWKNQPKKVVPLENQLKKGGGVFESRPHKGWPLFPRKLGVSNGGARNGICCFL